MHTEDHSECLETETTESPPPGCCMLADTRPSAYSNGWDDTCKAYHTEDACVRPYSQDGHARCVWQDTEEDFDCMNLWPTVGPTTPPAPGCCNGETLRASERCILSVEEDHCNRMSSCSWIVTDDPTECDYVEPTVPPPEPGCCNEATGAYSNGGHSIWTSVCRTFNTEMDCMTPLDQTSGDYRCEWTPTVEAPRSKPVMSSSVQPSVSWSNSGQSVSAECVPQIPDIFPNKFNSTQSVLYCDGHENYGATFLITPEVHEDYGQMNLYVPPRIRT